MNAPQAREDRVGLVVSLGVPADAEAPRRYIEDGGPVSAASLAGLVDDDVAERTWRRWEPTQGARMESPPFRAALREFLATGVGMGYALERVRGVCHGLPDFEPGGERWAELFERGIAATNTMDLRVFVSPEVRDSFAATNNPAAQEREQWDSMLSMMSDGLFYELGIVPPKVQLLSDSSLAATDLRIEINDARLPRCTLLAPGSALVNDTVDRLTLLNVQGEEALNPANDSECAVINAGDVAICQQAGLTTWSQMGHAVLYISAAARRMAGAFANCYLVDFYLEQLAQAFPTVVAEARKAVSREALAQLLRALLDEEISIRNLLRILEVLTLPDAVIVADLARYIVFNPSALDRMQAYREEPLLERRLCRVRASMKRFISHKYTRGGNTLAVYLLYPDLEARLQPPLPLSRQDQASLLRAVRNEVGTLAATLQTSVILTTASIRRRLRREIAAAMPRLAVLSYQELSPDMNIQPIGRIEAPELTKPEMPLGSPRAANSSLESLPPASADRLVRAVYSARPGVLAAASRKAGFGARTERLMPACLDALLDQLTDAGAAARLAGALQERANLPAAWNRVIGMILSLGAAAQATLAVPPADLPEDRWRYFADRARIRDATHELVRRVAAAALLRVREEDRR